MNKFRHVLFVLAATLCLWGCGGPNTNQIQTRSVDLDTPAPLVDPDTLGGADSPVVVSGPIDHSAQAFRGHAGTSPPPLPAEGLLDLSLETAVLSALARNKALHVEQFEPVIAGTFIETERAVFDPVLFAGGSYENYRDRSLDDVSARFFSIDGSVTQLRGGASQRFATGTDVTLDLTLSSRKDDDSDYSDEARAGLNLTQALLRDAGAAVNLVGIRQA